MCIVQSKFYLAMFAPRHAPYSNREVRHSPTWHSSKSESALERFEPVAAVQQLPDGRGSVFAPVAARRQKVFKRGIDTYAKHVCRRRRDESQSIPLFVLFVLFGQAKRTSKEKFLLCIYERPLVDFGFLAFPDSRRPEIRTAGNLFW